MSTKPDPEKAMLDDIIAHNTMMRVIEMVSEQPGLDVAPALAGVMTACAVLARLCDGNKTIEYRQRKNFMHECGGAFDHSLPVMRDHWERMKAAGEAPENALVEAVLEPSDINVLPKGGEGEGSSN